MEWTPQFLHNITAFNGKHRFQLAVHTVDNGVNATRRLVTSIYAMRCTSGHSVAVDTELLSTPLMAAQADKVAAITHTTMSINLASIFRYGLAPGGGNGD
eukprot:2085966-Heterocapsa_arctica.AAC.1